MNKEFDIRGQVCPSALLVTLREVNTMYGDLQKGEQALHVLTDSRKATETIPGAMANMGLKVEVSPQDGYYRVIIGQSD
jgi:TusA-related sulfurtransferase